MRAHSLTEWVVLGLVAEGTTHGFGLAKQLDADGPIGRMWTVRRPLVYRAVDTLLADGLLVEAGSEEGQGPRRRLLDITPAGREAVATWLQRPVEHVRDFRTELLVKLALLERAGRSSAGLVRRQRRRLEPTLAGLRQQLQAADGFEVVLARWRMESAAAAERFLDSL